jgi:hypothetical protein
MNLRVHIDRLVLDGFDFSGRDAAHLESALRSELTARLTTSGVSNELRTSGSVTALRPSHVSLPEKLSAAQSGRAIAQAIHRGIGE